MCEYNNVWMLHTLEYDFDSNHKKNDKLILEIQYIGQNSP
jgi:hypothetical protein